MKPAEEFLKEKDIKTFGAIICDGQHLIELLEEYAEKVAKNLHKLPISYSFSVANVHLPNGITIAQ